MFGLFKKSEASSKKPIRETVDKNAQYHQEIRREYIRIAARERLGLDSEAAENFYAEHLSDEKIIASLDRVTLADVAERRLALIKEHRNKHFK